MNRVLAFLGLSVAVALAGCDQPPSPTAPQPEGASRLASPSQRVGVNVVLRGPATPQTLAELSRFGTLLDRIDQINAVRVLGDPGDVNAIRALPDVAAADLDAERTSGPVGTAAASDLGDGINTWDLDAVNVTDFGQAGRTVAFDGSGVYVGVLDTGLQDNWRELFPAARIATQYAVAFSGGGADVGKVSDVPNQWEHDQNGHGTHVTSTVLGFDMGTRVVNGVAPGATVIPVKVLNQTSTGWGWSSVIARGIVHVADLKAGPLAGSPVVINMSLGGGRLDPVEKAAIDYAIAKGVIIVAAAGNQGTAGMSYPGAYAPVISAAASGWIGEWVGGSAFWRTRDVPDPTRAADFYIADFSGRAKAGQDLDVAAPGSWIVGPYMTNSGQSTFFFLGGTSMASPHVAGIVALMAQKQPSLRAADAERILESSAIRLGAGCRTVIPGPGAPASRICWGSDATGAGLATADAALRGVR
jgi:subtilisin family serine protease